MSVIGLIPARGSSREVPRKNLRLLHGVPLIAWTIRAACASSALDRIIVSTEDAEIAEVSSHFGAEVPFMRPPELAKDETPGIAPVLHAIDQLAEVKHVLLLQPTSPLRSSSDIRDILEFSRTAGAQAAVSVTRNSHPPGWAFRMSPSGRFQVPDDFQVATHRQHAPATFSLNGAMYFAECSWLRSSQSFITSSTLMYEMPPERSLDIDSEFDLRLAELLLSRADGLAILADHDSTSQN